MNNRWIKIVLGTIIIMILVVVVIVLGKNSGKFVPDNVRFGSEYTDVGENNIYVYATKSEVIEAFEADKAVVLFGFPECAWCQAYVKLLNEIAKEYGVQKILYYNIKEDRENKSDFYIQVTDMLKGNLYTDDEGEPRIYVPDVYFIKRGEIIGHNNDTSTISGMELDEYYTDENTNNLQQKLNALFTEYSSCDDKKGC